MLHRGRMYYGYQPHRLYFANSQGYYAHDSYKYYPNRTSFAQKQELYEGNDYKELNHKSAPSPIKYVKKEKSQKQEVECNNIQVERADSPLTSCSSTSDIKSNGNTPVSVFGSELVNLGKPNTSDNTQYCIPKVHHKDMCPAHLIPLPSFIAEIN